MSWLSHAPVLELPAHSVVEEDLAAPGTETMDKTLKQLTSETVSRRYLKLLQKERDAENALKETKKQIATEITALRERCPHKNIQKYYGGACWRDNFSECQDCGKEMPR